MSTYGGAKGRAPSASLKPVNRAPLPELSAAEKEEITGRVRLVKQHLPDAWEFMKELSAEGMIDGMRCLASVTVYEGVENGIG